MTWILVAVIAALLVERAWERRNQREEAAAWRLERAGLLQRIQAPELAVVEHQTASHTENPMAVSMHDDRDYWAALDRVGQMEREGL